jgi:hypothetical protein
MFREFSCFFPSNENPQVDTQAFKAWEFVRVKEKKIEAQQVTSDSYGCALNRDAKVYQCTHTHTHTRI